MTYFLFFTLCALSAFFLIRGLWRKDGIYQFPVIFSAAFAFSTVPQLVNYVFYPPRLPPQVYADHGVDYGILMCILCLVAGVAGYYAPLRQAPVGLRRLLPDVHAERMFWAGVALGLIGLYGSMRVDALAGGFRARFTEGGHYDLEWTGAPVLWIYVGKCLWFALPLCLLGVLRRGTILKWMISAALLLYPVMSIIFLGRRSATFGLAVILLLSLWFQKRWAPPRVVAIAGMAVGGMLIILLPHYRMEANKTGDIKMAIEQVNVDEAVNLYLQGGRSEGMENLILGIPARMYTGSFTYGAGFWNAVVEDLVPAQIVGRETKNALVLQIGQTDAVAFGEYCGLLPEYGAFQTGPYSVYTEFWFFGCLLYAVVGLGYRHLWFLASEQELLSAQVLYVVVALLPAMSVVNSLTGALPLALLAASVVLAAMWAVGKTGTVPQRRRTSLRTATRRLGRGKGHRRSASPFTPHGTNTIEPICEPVKGQPKAT